MKQRLEDLQKRNGDSDAYCYNLREVFRSPTLRESKALGYGCGPKVVDSSSCYE